MFLDTVILVLQEILEAALIISVFLALIRHFHDLKPGSFTPGHLWIPAAVLIGVSGAWIYAFYMPDITQWFDYVGLEIVNSALQIMIIILLLCFCYMVTLERLEKSPRLNLLVAICLTLLVSLGIIREVSEIIIYAQGILSNPENYSPVLLGSLIAIGIGASSGIILYYVLINLHGLWGLRICLILLALFAGNMASQASLLLIQADWLPYTVELWDSSALLPEYSVTGQLLYALIGYEANPSLLQVCVYIGAVLLILTSPLFLLSWRYNNMQAVSNS
ncbi:MAG: hypothetical protein CMP91_00175 [Gammaproteobacteria bacterium]|nr:hypothetical protein [Gammaproteobacteria bacterium]|tara:strand:+ start:31429 stop:32259 length:831 start_codon:yes stop_codon:yes gene_type:complete